MFRVLAICLLAIILDEPLEMTITGASEVVFLASGAYGLSWVSLTFDLMSLAFGTFPQTQILAEKISSMIIGITYML
jgi:hypothetical protein